MLFRITHFLALAAAAVYTQAQAPDPSINTPASVVQCQPVLITWTATKSPVFLSIIPGGKPGAPALQDFGQQNGTSFTWTVNIAAGTSITLQVRDSAAPVTIQTSPDSSCVGAGSPTSVAPTSAAPTSVASASATPPAR